MNEQERLRYNELVFYQYISGMLKKYKNPISVYKMVRSSAELAGCDMNILNSVLNETFTNEKAVAPIKEESMYLLRLSGTPVREICKYLHAGNSTYYKYRYNEYRVEPKFSKEQNEEMYKLMRFIIDLAVPMQRRLG